MKRKQHDNTFIDQYVAVKTVLSAKKAVEEAHSARLRRKQKPHVPSDKTIHDSSQGRSTSAKNTKLSSGVPEEDLAALDREMKVLQQLNDDHVVRYIGGNLDDVMLVMEYVDGGDLSQLVREQAPIVRWENKGRQIMQTIADTVARLHEKGFIHRDLKSSNILLTSDCVVKLADVGSAVRLFRAAVKRNLKGPSKASDGVTPYYAAPECWKGDTVITEAVDVFSLGVLLWEMWNHQLVQRELVDDMTAAVAHMPEDISNILSAALETDSTKRISASEFARRLRACRQGSSEPPPTADAAQRSMLVAYQCAAVDKARSLRLKYSSAFQVMLDTASSFTQDDSSPSALSSFRTRMKALEVSQLCSAQLEAWVEQYLQATFDCESSAWGVVFNLLSSDDDDDTHSSQHVLFRYILFVSNVVNSLVGCASSSDLEDISRGVQLSPFAHSWTILSFRDPQSTDSISQTSTQLQQHLCASATELLEVTESFLDNFDDLRHRDALVECRNAVALSKAGLLRLPLPRSTVAALRVLNFDELNYICRCGSIDETQSLYEKLRLELANTSELAQVENERALNNLEARYQLFLLWSHLQRRLRSTEPHTSIVRAVKLVATKLVHANEVNAAWGLITGLFQRGIHLGREDDELIVMCAALGPALLGGSVDGPVYRNLRNLLLPIPRFDWRTDRESLRNVRERVKANLVETILQHSTSVSTFIKACLSVTPSTASACPSPQQTTDMSQWADRYFSQQLLSGMLISLFRALTAVSHRISMLSSDAESILGRAPVSFSMVALGSLASRRMTVMSDVELALLVDDAKLVSWDFGDQASTVAGVPTDADMARRWLHSFLVYCELRVIALGESKFEKSHLNVVKAGSFSGLCMDSSASLLQRTDEVADLLRLLKGSPLSILANTRAASKDAALRKIMLSVFYRSRCLFQRFSTSQPVEIDLYRQLVRKKTLLIRAENDQTSALVDVCNELIRAATVDQKDATHAVFKSSSFSTGALQHPWSLSAVPDPHQLVKKAIDQPFNLLLDSLVCPVACGSIDEVLKVLRQQFVISDYDASVLSRVDTILRLCRQMTAVSAYEAAISSLNKNSNAHQGVAFMAAELCFWAAVRPLALLARKLASPTSSSAAPVFLDSKKYSVLLNAVFAEIVGQETDRHKLTACWLCHVAWGLLSGISPSDFTELIQSLPIDVVDISALESLCHPLRWLLEKSNGAWLDASWEAWVRSVLKKVESIPSATGECVIFVRGERKWSDAISSVFCPGGAPLQSASKREEIPSSQHGGSFYRVQIAFVATADEVPPVVDLKFGAELLAKWTTIADDLIVDRNRKYPKESDIRQSDPPQLSRASDSFFGRHKVFRTATRVHLENHTCKQLYLRLRPELPGLESAVNVFIRMVTGYTAAPYVDLWAFYDQRRPAEKIPVLVSTEAEGLTLLEELRTSSSGRIERLHFPSFCRLALASMLINPEDGKEDNYIVTRDERNGEAIIVAIDNDHSFVEPFYDEGLINKRRRLQLKCILFCFDEMQLPVDEDTLLFIERISIPDFVLRWLQRCQQSDRRFEAVFPRSSWSQLMAHRDEWSRTSVPMQLTQLAIVQVCDKLYRLQRLVRQFRKQSKIPKNGKVGVLTLLDLLRAADPLVCQFYERSLSTSSQTVIERFRELTQDEYETVDVSMMNQPGANASSLSCFVTRSGVSRLLTKSHIGVSGQRKESLQYLSTLIQRAERLKTKLTDITEITQHFAANNFKPFSDLLSNETRSVVAWSVVWDASSGSRNSRTLPAMWSSLNPTAALSCIAKEKCNFERFQLRRYRIAKDASLVGKTLQNMSFLLRLDCSECAAVDDSTFVVLSAYCPQLQRIDARMCINLQFIRSKSILGRSSRLLFPNLELLDLAKCENLQRCHVSAWRLRFVHLAGTRLSFNRLQIDSWIPACEFKEDAETTVLWSSKMGDHQVVETALCYLGDGMLASGSDDAKVRLWNVKEGRCVSELEGHSRTVTSLAYLGDGMLASGSTDETICLWNVKDGLCVNVLEGHTDTVWSLAYLGEGLLASGSWDKTVRLWSVKEGRCVSVLEGHTDTVWSLAYLGDGKLASGSWDNTIRLWHVKEGGCLSVLTGHTDTVSSLAHLGEHMIASGSDDKTVRLWNVKDGRCVSVLKGHTSTVASLVYLGEGLLASGSWDETVRLWNLKEGRCVSVWKGHTSTVRSVAYLGDGAVATSSEDKTIRLWNIAEDRYLHMLEKQTDTLWSLPSLNTHETSQQDGTFAVNESRCMDALEGHTDTVWSLTYLGDSTLASGSVDETIRLWNVKGGQCVSVLKGHTDTVSSLASLGDDMIASGSVDGTVRLWSVKEGRCVNVLKGHTSTVRCLAYLRDGILASGSWDETVRLWNVKEGRCVRVLTGHSSTVTSLAYLGASMLASGSEDRTIRLWSIKEGQCVRVLEGHTDTVWSLAYLRDGMLASGSWDKTVRLWNVKEGRCVCALEGHSNTVTSLAYVGDGMFASGSWDKTVRLWNVKECRNVCALEGLTDRVWSLAYLGDGTLAIGSADKTIRLKDVSEFLI